MNILCATDDNYVPYCGIMLTSLFENNKEQDIVVYLMTAGLNKKNIVDFEKLANQYKQEINIILVDNIALKNCPIRIGDHVSIAAYYRLLAPILLPDSVDKVLYLDCDMIINKSLNDLYNINVENYALGAVLDEDFQNQDKYDRLQYDYEKGYFNSGMLLMNLDYWRKNNVMVRCLDYIDKNSDKILFHDQDTLNVVLQDEKKLLSITYNFQTGFVYTRYNFSKELFSQICKTIKNIPVILHYTGPGKVWAVGSKHPYVEYYLYYRSISLWKDFPLIDNRSLKDRLLQLRNELIWKLGIKKRPQTYIIDCQKFKIK